MLNYLCKKETTMIEFEDIILNNPQFLSLTQESLNCNSFLFESNDEVFLSNFSYCFAKFIMCDGEHKPCGECLNCKKISLLSHADLNIYPKGHKGILTEDVKDLIENIYLSPIESDKKVFVINNFSYSTISAQNKLLKILEEPPKNVYIILNVTNINKVLPTILSRCKKLRLNPLSDSEIKQNLASLPAEKQDYVVGVVEGNLSKAIMYASSEEFFDIYKNVLSCIVDMKDSKQLAMFSYGLCKFKGENQTILEVFESLYRDMLLLKLKREDLVKNKGAIKALLSVIDSYNGDSIDLIIRRLYDIKKQLDFNCNSVLLFDNLLLYILEVKFLCNNK